MIKIAQTYVRSIKRSKATKLANFCNKLSVTQTEDFARMNPVDIDNFNEGALLQEQIKGYKALYGYYPE